ncbi:ATP-binding protein [Actinophytocola oryzae]|uniref:Anti-sigma regulatory factor (Ser/Thr protein kinase) n=1 Tax=Actinophytocola oryzae TaxID=502181 RepID=A0A4R7W569_9PSEU|nr:ATP-binding protein [Actinophytocola oryzae]TDV57883.1 anti-sigma regulatory factor (Ser/Thr protein kinase) [Actinophytocola oryzae]
MDEGDLRGARASGGGLGHRTVPDLWLPGIPAVVGRLTGVRQRLVRWGTQAGLSEEQVDDVGLATYEAMANVVDHAYPDGTGEFDLHAASERDLVTVTVTDHGRWKPHATTPGPMSLRGRGLMIMEKLSSRFELTPRVGGTTVCMSWSLPLLGR